MACEQCSNEDIQKYLDNVSSTPVSDSEMTKAISEVMQLLNTKTCEYESQLVTGFQTATQFESGANLGWTGAEVQTEFEASAGEYPLGENISKVGCDTLSVMAQRYAQTKKVMTMVMSCNCQSLDSLVTNMNSINLTLDDSSCANLYTDQSILANIKIINELSQTQETAIDSLLDSMIDTTVTAIENEVTQSPSPDTDSKLMTMESEINEEFVTNVINTNISAIKSEIQNVNNLNVTLKGSHIAGDCSFKQSIILDQVVSNALSNTISSILDTQSMQDLISTLDVERTETEKEFGGAGSEFQDIQGDDSGLGGIGVDGSASWQIILIIIGIILLIIIIFAVVKKVMK